jgi:hypothetical protein
MIKKDAHFKKTSIEKEDFEKVMATIVVAPKLCLSLYTFTYDHSLTMVLTQKDKKGDECIISFMITGLQGIELNYLAIDKRGFTIYKSIK